MSCPELSLASSVTIWRRFETRHRNVLVWMCRRPTADALPPVRSHGVKMLDVVRPVAIVGCRRSPEADESDLYPDPDAELLSRAIETLGFGAKLVAWDTVSVDWSQFARVVLSSTWDGVDRPDEVSLLGPSS